MESRDISSPEFTLMTGILGASGNERQAKN
jgi:hypothetical protein